MISSRGAKALVIQIEHCLQPFSTTTNANQCEKFPLAKLLIHMRIERRGHSHVIAYIHTQEHNFERTVYFWTFQYCYKSSLLQFQSLFPLSKQWPDIGRETWEHKLVWSSLLLWLLLSSLMYSRGDDPGLHLNKAFFLRKCYPIPSSYTYLKCDIHANTL